MTNEHAAQLLVSLYAAWSRRSGRTDEEYELAVAYAVAALGAQKEEDGDG